MLSNTYLDYNNYYFFFFSTMSAQLNTVSGTIYKDFVVKMISSKFSELTASIIMKCTVVIIGIFCVILVLIIERLKGLLQASIYII